MNNRTPVEAVEAAISHVGSATKLAAALQVSDQTVSFWRRGERDGRPIFVPAEKCLLIERVTARRVFCEELLPHAAWDVIRSTEPAADFPAVQEAVIHD